MENSSIYLRRKNLSSVATVSERHAPPNHANTQLKDKGDCPNCNKMKQSTISMGFVKINAKE